MSGGKVDHLCSNSGYHVPGTSTSQKQGLCTWANLPILTRTSSPGPWVSSVEEDKQRHVPAEGPRTCDGAIIRAHNDRRLEVNRGNELVDEHCLGTGSGTRAAPQERIGPRCNVHGMRCGPDPRRSSPNLTDVVPTLPLTSPAALDLRRNVSPSLKAGPS